MPAIVLDGKACSKELEAELTIRVARLNLKDPPILATILVGEDPASATYVRMKGNACRRVGMESLSLTLPATTSTEKLLTAIDELNTNPRVRGILLQHPDRERR
jgi:methylenetetrahydrofolate dehydrogenase (NADP+)/methenyltetrahydrofolate cyclohydrolase